MISITAKLIIYPMFSILAGYTEGIYNYFFCINFFDAFGVKNDFFSNVNTNVEFGSEWEF